jgi:hypothetical protein
MMKYAEEQLATAPRRGELVNLREKLEEAMKSMKMS